MNGPWLSIVLPTAGRRAQLFHTLQSIRHQSPVGVETLVVLDTHLPAEKARLQQLHNQLDDLRMGIRWLEHDGGVNCYGQPQRSFGARQATGEWVAFSQDDNILAEHALVTISAAVARQPHPRPIFFRVLTPWRAEVWAEPELRLGNIDADCLVLPRAIAHEVVWGLRYEGDFDAAVEASHLVAGDVDWRAETIAIARPEPAHLWWGA